MKLIDILKRLSPSRKPLFEKVNGEEQERRDSDVNFPPMPSAIELRLIDRSRTRHTHTADGGGGGGGGHEGTDFQADFETFDENEESSSNVYNPLSEEVYDIPPDGEPDLHLNNENPQPQMESEQERRLLQRQFSRFSTISGRPTGQHSNQCRRMGIALVVSALFIVISTLAVTALLLANNWHLLGPQENGTSASLNISVPQSSRIQSNIPDWPLPGVTDEEIKSQNATEIPAIVKLPVHEEMTTVTPNRSNSLPMRLPVPPIPPPKSVFNFHFTGPENGKDKIEKRKLPVKFIREGYLLAKKMRRVRKQNFTHAEIMEDAYRLIAKRMNVTLEELQEGRILLNGTLPPDLCPSVTKQPHCNESEIFRRFDGRCNNLKKPLWGAAHQPFRRTLFPRYDDGISSPRTLTKSKKQLPSVRTVSETVHIDEYREDPEVSLMLSLWGHFIIHDLLHTSHPQQQPFESADKPCCDVNEKQINSDSCFPIKVPLSDPFYSRFNITCLNYTRAEPFSSCNFGQREFINQASSFLDGSHIYGTTKEIADSLRTFSDGEMNLYDSLDGLILPPLWNDPKDNSSCLNSTQIRGCFRGGDARINSVATITVLQTIWLRHHNRVAAQLKMYNQHWSDHKLFETARSIIIAQLQHITYSEFLPLLLPPEVIREAGLELNPTEYYTKYEADINPEISIAATTALQFVHSMTQGLLNLKKTKDDMDFVQYSKLVANPHLLLKKNDVSFIDKVIRSVVSEPSVVVDAYVSGQLIHHYDQVPNGQYGSDLIALTLQWGRDAGTPPYTNYREKCGLSKLTTFDEFLKNGWDFSALERVKEVYKSAEDIDLLTGLLSENPMKSGRLGPTLSCLIADTFSRLRRGDMFWYEGDIRDGHFTPDQLESIRETTLSKILCDNSDGINMIQENAMLKLSNDRNPEYPCSSLSRVGLSAWRQKRNNPNEYSSGEMRTTTEEIWSDEEWMDSIEVED